MGNVAIGNGTLSTNTTGLNNKSVGINVMNSNTTGLNNTTLGYGSDYTNTTGLETCLLVIMQVILLKQEVITFLLAMDLLSLLNVWEV